MTAGPRPDEPPVERLVEALLDGDREAAETLLLDVLETVAFSEAVDEFVRPAMAEIGDRWADNAITVADEHLATAVMQTALARAYREARAEAPGESRMLLACVEGNDHALGLRTLADAFELGGWSVRHLGADVPTQALADQVERWRPDVVCLSVSMPDQRRTAEDAIGRIREALGDEAPTVLVGGRAGDPSWAEGAGADAWASNVREAFEAVA